MTALPCRPTHPERRTAAARTCARRCAAGIPQPEDLAPIGAGRRQSIAAALDGAGSRRAPPHVHYLSNGRYSLLITASGGGFSRWQDLDSDPLARRYHPGRLGHVDLRAGPGQRQRCGRPPTSRSAPALCQQTSASMRTRQSSAARDRGDRADDGDRRCRRMMTSRFAASRCTIEAAPAPAGPDQLR